MIVKKKPAKRMWIVGEQWEDGWEWFSFTKKADALRFVNVNASISDAVKVSDPFCYERVEEEK